MLESPPYVFARRVVLPADDEADAQGDLQERCQDEGSFEDLSPLHGVCQVVAFPEQFVQSGEQELLPEPARHPLRIGRLPDAREEAVRIPHHELFADTV